MAALLSTPPEVATNSRGPPTRPESARRWPRARSAVAPGGGGRGMRWRAQRRSRAGDRRNTAWIGWSSLATGSPPPPRDRTAARGGAAARPGRRRARRRTRRRAPRPSQRMPRGDVEADDGRRPEERGPEAGERGDGPARFRPLVEAARRGSRDHQGERERREVLLQFEEPSD